MCMNKKDFAVFILTYGRPANVITYNNLRKQGYTGEIFLICSNDDKTLGQYVEKYKKAVIVFDKKDYKKDLDLYDNSINDKIVVYARNANFDIAEKLGYKYFMQFDDDYTDFTYRFDNNYNYVQKNNKIKNLDKLFCRIFDYYNSIQALSIAFSQGGDFIGGRVGGSASNIKTKRKIMNLYFMRTDRRFKFTGRINEDVNTYVDLGVKGELMFQLYQVSLDQKTTQKNAGGLTDIYLESGTYIKSFYSILVQPACVKIMLMGNKQKRLHHSVNWNLTTPKIIREEYKKI